MQLSAGYQAAFTDMLEGVATWRARSGITLSACWPEQGVSFQPGRGLLVVGRATNGFEDPFTAAEVATVEARKTIAAKARKFAETYSLRWLRNPSRSGGTTATRSSFWRVTAAAVRALDIYSSPTTVPWDDSVAWTNLAKVAPSKSGNPTGRLLDVQVEACSDLVKLEVEEMQPLVVLVIAGQSWCERFSAGLEWSTPASFLPGPVMQVQRVANRLWIFCDRPERRPENAFINGVRQTLSEHGSWLSTR